MIDNNSLVVDKHDLDIVWRPVVDDEVELIKCVRGRLSPSVEFLIFVRVGVGGPG